MQQHFTNKVARQFDSVDREFRPSKAPRQSRCHLGMLEHWGQGCCCIHPVGLIVSIDQVAGPGQAPAYNAFAPGAASVAGSGFSSPSMVGISSETVGWMCIALCRTV